MSVQQRVIVGRFSYDCSAIKQALEFGDSEHRYQNNGYRTTNQISHRAKNIMDVISVSGKAQ